MSDEKVIAFSIGKGLKKSGAGFERAHPGDVGRKMVELLRLRFTSPAAAVVHQLVERVKSPDGNVRDEAIKSMINIAATEEELWRNALKIALMRAKELPRSISMLKRYVAVFDEHTAAAERALIRTTDPLS
jgi:hypothetical protein